MTVAVRVPARLLDAVGGAPPGALERRLLERGRAVLAADGPGLRGELARRAAALALLRHALLEARGRAGEAAAREARTYREHLRLARDEVPPLELRARELRSEIRALEAELRARGVDPAAIAPTLPGDTLAVDDHDPPAYRTPEERRRRAVEFFRRIGG